jgi:hypothetical protein
MTKIQNNSQRREPRTRGVATTTSIHSIHDSIVILVLLFYLRYILAHEFVYWIGVRARGDKRSCGVIHLSKEGNEGPK